jgi:hypothetical protein
MGEEISTAYIDPKFDRRRTIRMKRSRFLEDRLGGIDRPAIKFAETIKEIEGAFSLCHDEYIDLKYLKKEKTHGMFFGIHSLLPDTSIFIFKSFDRVISSVTQIFDSQVFGLPMDAIYKDELDTLRTQGRKIVEFSALVTHKDMRSRNIFMHLVYILYHYSFFRGVNDWCIAVNPKHVPFYKEILLFEELGPQRYFPKVDAPAIALRNNMDTYEQRLKKIYEPMEFECDLYSFFHRMTGKKSSQRLIPEEIYCDETREMPRNTETIRYFLEKENELIRSLSVEQKRFLNKAYPGLDL